MKIHIDKTTSTLSPTSSPFFSKKTDEGFFSQSARATAKNRCPGSKENRTYISAPYPQVKWGVGHPKNVGDKTLRIVCIDENGELIKGSSKALSPGESIEWFYPVEGTYIIAFVCEASSGEAILEYDLPVA